MSAVIPLWAKDLIEVHPTAAAAAAVAVTAAAAAWAEGVAFVKSRR